jgi:hypothetical protein
VVEVSHVKDAPCAGQPKTSQAVIDSILKTVTQNSTTQSWSCAKIASTVSSPILTVSVRMVWRVLR